LNFKKHVEQCIAKAKRAFHSIERLTNTEKGLSFQAMRQLYIACITTIADYGTPLWWNFQKQYIDQFATLQNAALRKMLGVFRTTPISIMEIEAAVAPVSIRLEKQCKNYAVRILQMDSSHPMQERIKSSHQLSAATDTPISFRKPAKFSNTNVQLERIMGRIENYSTNFFRLEKFSAKLNSSHYTKCDIRIAETAELAFESFLSIKEKIENNPTQMEYYTDGSKFPIDEATGAAFYRSCNKATSSNSWFLGYNMEVFDAELYAIYESMKDAEIEYAKSNI